MALRLNLTSLLITLGVVLFISKTTSAADVDGGWSPWSEYGSPCSTTCGPGTYIKHRSCSNPSPEGAGAKCLASDGTRATHESKQTSCEVTPCFIGTYANWTECEDCVSGSRYKFPFCAPNLLCDPVYFSNLTIEEKCPGWNKTECPSPCEEATCPGYAKCVDLSTDEEPLYTCKCTMGRIMKSDKSDCIVPPPPKPTPRPIPVLPEAEKKVATVMSRTASTVLIIFVGITLILFGILRIFTPDRVIQMNMEIALILAHIFLMFPPTTYENPALCKTVSVFIHLFFTACFNFMMLEALHMYSMVAYVVQRDGMFTRTQNTLIGWLLAIIIVLFCLSFDYEDYGGEYHCWLQMDKNLMLGQWIPYLITSIVTLTLTEAAGAAEYKPLKGVDSAQRLSAQISQRSNLIILPFVVTHMLLGMYAEYEQNLGLYGTFSVVNGITGGLIFFLHCTGNQEVRAKIVSVFKGLRKE